MTASPNCLMVHAAKSSLWLFYGSGFVRFGLNMLFFIFHVEYVLLFGCECYMSVFFIVN